MRLTYAFRIISLTFPLIATPVCAKKADCETTGIKFSVDTEATPIIHNLNFTASGNTAVPFSNDLLDEKITAYKEARMEIDEYQDSFLLGIGTIEIAEKTTKYIPYSQYYIYINWSTMNAKFLDTSINYIYDQYDPDKEISIKILRSSLPKITCYRRD